MRIWVLSLLLFLSSAAVPAAADEVTDAIVAYNQAREAGEANAHIAASIKLGDTALANKTNPNAVIMAFEAGQTLCLLQDCQGASPYADWAATQIAENAGLRTADIALLQAYAAWRGDTSGRTRNALNRALTSVETTEPTLLSMVAFATRYQSDMADGRWGAVRRSAGAAAKHFESDKSTIPTYYINAKSSQTIADFVDRPTPEGVLDFARLEVEWEVLNHEFGIESEPGMKDLYWIINAWHLATQAYTISDFSIAKRKRNQIVEEAELILDDIPAGARCNICQASEASEEPLGDRKLPFCEGTFNMEPEMEYPELPAWRGYFGAVLLRLSVKNGEVDTVEPLAAVPTKVFEQHAIDTVKQWTWKVESGTPGETCRLDRSNIILPLTFQFE